MTEAGWLASQNPSALLDAERHRRPLDRVPARNLRLYICACCRRLPAALFTGRLAEAVGLVERFVDRVAGAGELNRFRGRLVHEGERPDAHPPSAVGCALSSNLMLWSAAGRITELLVTGGDPPGNWDSSAWERAAVERSRCAGFIRDIFGSPFRSSAFASGWRTDTAVALARLAYEGREFGVLPILADALQDAGCDDEAVLGHCRDTAAHVRGCWVVDLVLGKR